MRRRGVMAGLVGLALAAGTTTGSLPGTESQELWVVQTGEVVVWSDVLTATTIITLDADNADEMPGDGTVDQAFRIQRPAAMRAYRGPATVSYGPGWVFIQPSDEAVEGFGFVVGAETAADAPFVAAVGLSRFWGEHIRRTVADVQATLGSARCGGDRFARELRRLRRV